jgi:hypothetical protein
LLGEGAHPSRRLLVAPRPAQDRCNHARWQRSRLSPNRTRRKRRRHPSRERAGEAGAALLGLALKARQDQARQRRVLPVRGRIRHRPWPAWSRSPPPQACSREDGQRGPSRTCWQTAPGLRLPGSPRRATS